MVEDTAPTEQIVADILATPELTFETEQEREIAAKLLPGLAAKANALAEANKMRELNSLVEGIRVENKKAIEEKLEEYRKSMTPPSTDELQVLLSQEFVEFKFKLIHDGVQKDFVIRELPLQTETNIIKALRRTLAERVQEISSIEWLPGMASIERVQKVMELVPGAIETVADCVALCLDPFQEKSIDGKWVMRNVGSSRMMAIIHAQIQASRYRDFLSLASRVMPGLTTV